MRRTLTGAWIETFIGATNEPKPLSRTLTGAWIETHHFPCLRDSRRVAPSRVRGLKPKIL